MRLIGNEQDGFHALVDGTLTQLLQCERCERWSDDVGWSDEYGGGLCIPCKIERYR